MANLVDILNNGVTNINNGVATINNGIAAVNNIENLALSLLGITSIGGAPFNGLSADTSFDIDSFRTHFANHLETSRTDKFDVWINIPQAVAQGVSMQDLSLQCEISELPGKDINMIEFRHYGFTKRIPHINQYNHITFTFICAGDLFEKQLFDRWMDFMLPAQTGIIEYPQDSTGNFIYAAQIMINQRDNLNNIAYQVQLFNAMPVGISPMSQSWQDDSVHRLSVTFAYEKWTSAATIYTSPATSLGGTSNASLASSSNTGPGTISNFNNP